MLKIRKKIILAPPNFRDPIKFAKIGKFSDDKIKWPKVFGGSHEETHCEIGVREFLKQFLKNANEVLFKEKCGLNSFLFFDNSSGCFRVLTNSVKSTHKGFHI